MSIQSGQNALASEMSNIGHFVAGETISANDAVSLNYSDYKIYKASAAAFDHRLNFIGFALAGASSGAAVNINTANVVNEKTGLTSNTLYYLSNTQGAISTSAGTYERLIGRTVTTSKIIRKRGMVALNAISIASSGTAPCDGALYFTVGGGSNYTITSGSVSGGEDETAGFMIPMGRPYSSVGSAWFIPIDFGGFW